MTDKEYLKMVDEQLKEAKENMDSAEKSYIEAKAKYDSVIKFRESYVTWIRGGNKK